MEAIFVRDRVHLWDLRGRHPDWTHRQLGEAVERSRTWVKKWLRRFKTHPPEDHPDVFFSRSRAPHQPRHKVTTRVRERILAIRDNPPENLRRRPGPVTILYFLHRQTGWSEEAPDLPTSSRTIWRVLVEAGRIARPHPRQSQPVDLPAPDERWALDFKDISTVSAGPRPDSKKQHLVEALNVVDEGTSRWIDYQVRDDFRMETTIVALFGILLLKGCPTCIKTDRDPRFIGGWTADEFPSPWMRFLLCLGIELIILPPRRPDLNPFVERFHRSLKEEVILVERPANLEQSIDAFERYHPHYNHERPNQALSCGNQPPAVAFPELPPLRSLPDTVDPDAWLEAIDRRAYDRKINRNGSVQLGGQRYYIKQALAGQTVTLVVLADVRQLRVVHNGQVIKVLDIKGLFQGVLSLSEFVRLMVQQARTIDRQLRLV